MRVVVEVILITSDMAATKIDVYDLDETLLCGNSTRLYLSVLLRVSWQRMCLLTWARAVATAALRASRLISHRRFKWMLWHCGAGMSRGCAAEFDAMYRREFERMLRPSMVEALACSRREGRHILVATAAYREVLASLASRIDGAVATDTEGVARYRDYMECRGEEKARRVREYARSRGAEVATVYTDGADDEPLMALAEEISFVRG